MTRRIALFVGIVTLTATLLWGVPVSRVLAHADATPASTPMAGMESHSGMGGMGAAFMVIRNGGDADRLVAGQTDVAKVVEIHEMAEVDGVMEMRPLADGLEIAADGETILEPGGYHIMLIGLNEDLTAGMTYDLTLQFERAGDVTVSVQVRPHAEHPGATPTAAVTAGDLAIENVWSRPAPALGGEEKTKSAMDATVTIGASETLGDHLVNSAGLTLYTFARDELGLSACYDQCAANWPPLTIEAGAMPMSPAELPGELGTITRDDGALQVTYADQPLYLYADDTMPGDAKGQGQGDVWFVALVEPTP